MARTIQLIAEAGVAPDELQAFFTGALISPVLTAHPTEVQRKSILDCQLEIARLSTSATAWSRRPRSKPETKKACDVPS